MAVVSQAPSIKLRDAPWSDLSAASRASSAGFDFGSTIRAASTRRTAATGSLAASVLARAATAAGPPAIRTSSGSATVGGRSYIVAGLRSNQPTYPSKIPRTDQSTLP